MSYYEFPHSRNYDGDLGFIIKKIIELSESYDKFFKYNTIHFADPIEWNITTQYAPFTIVFDTANGSSYISKQPVPAGITLDNVDFWSFVGPLIVDGEARTGIERILHFVTNIYEAGPTATALRQVGDYIINAGQLWKVILTVNVGETYTSGYNVQPTTIENMIHEIVQADIPDTDYVLSTISPNPIANKTVATKFNQVDSNINQLSNKVDTNTADIESANDSISDEINARISADNLINDRIDNLATIPSGSTTADAELMDIRVGFNGKQYTSAGNAVRNQFIDSYRTIYEITDLNPIVEYGWSQGTAFIFNNAIAFDPSPIRCRLPLERVVNGLAKVVCNPGYEVGYIIANKSNGTFGTPVTSVGFASSWDISEYTQDYYIVLVARKSDNSNISVAEASANVLTISKFAPIKELDSTLPYINTNVVTPTQVYNDSLYYTQGNTIINSVGGYCKKYTIGVDTDFKINSSILLAGAGFDTIAYFDSADNYLSSEYPITPNVQSTISMGDLHIPSGAAYFYLNGRYSEPNAYLPATPTMTLPQIISELDSNRDEVSILFVGNSLTQDGISYLPYLLKNYYPDIKFNFYMWYVGGATLNDQYAKFTSNANCDIFSSAENSGRWTSTQKTMSEICSNYKFDYVVMQEYFNYKTEYTAADITDWNNCKDYITSHYTGGNGLEFVSLFHAPKRDNVESIMNLALQGNADILQQTIADDMLGNGLGITFALDTTLDSLGDQGHLSPDGTHDQEGLPCLIETYVAALWLFDRLGRSHNIYGCPLRITNDVYTYMNVPGANPGTGVITGTDSQNLLAQECAIKAYKFAKKFVANNISEV